MLGNLLGPLGVRLFTESEAQDDLYRALHAQARQNAMAQMNASQQYVQHLGMLSLQASSSQWQMLQGWMNSQTQYTKADYIRWEVERFQRLKDKQFLKARPTPVPYYGANGSGYEIEMAAWHQEYDRRFLLRPMG